MKYKTLFRTSFFVLVNIFLRDVESVVVKVEQGLLRGEVLEVVTGDAEYISFKGIPYAKPPIGDLRYMPPQPPKSWNGVRNATQHGSVCVQRYKYNPENIIGNEDCLFLNVYTPTVNRKERLAVIFFLHGGGFLSGSGNVDRYGPDYLMTQNVVVVTINYRLGSFGFLTLNTKEAPGNAALKDQVAALRWVQKNIAEFGGDPNKVTIVGQSVGAASVGLHNLSPTTKGLFKRGVMMSGGPLNDYAWPLEPRRVAFKFGEQMGIHTQDDQELLQFLRSVPAEQLMKTDPVLLNSENPNIIIKQLIFTPNVETHNGANKYLTLDQAQALRQGKVHNVDLMIGHAAIEGLFFYSILDDKIRSLYTNYTDIIVPRKILENTPPAKIFDISDKIRSKYFGENPVTLNKDFIKYLSDIIINYPVLKYANIFSKFRRTFLYEFSIESGFPRYQDLSNEYVSGAAHEDDLYYLFYANDGNITITKDSEQYRLVQTVCTLYANFAKYGNPTPDKCLGVIWPQYNTNTQYYLNIKSNLTVEKRLDADAVSFWDSIYEAANLAF